MAVTGSSQSSTLPRHPARERLAGSIDVHTHVGIDPGFYQRGWWPYASTAQDLLTHMDAAGIERAVCFPFTLPSAFDIEAFRRDGRIELLPGRVPFDRENLLLAGEVERIGQGRMMQFAMFDPEREVAAQIRLIEPLLPRIAGLKTQSTVLQSRVINLLNGGRELMHFAEQHGLPVLFHTSIHRADAWAQAADCLAVAAAFPNVRFNLAHSLRFHLPSLKRAAELSNVWVDCSAHLNHCRLACDESPVVARKQERVDVDYTRPDQVLRVIHELLGGKYMWGSDNPYMSWCANNLKLVFSYREEADVLHALPETVKKEMAVTAPRAWLGHAIEEKR
jgi:predicted TIM-barrel fold metal-dependent hydrolase